MSRWMGGWCHVGWLGGGVLNIGLIRMNILMLDTRNVEQTKDVHMYT